MGLRAEIIRTEVQGDGYPIRIFSDLDTMTHEYKVYSKALNCWVTLFKLHDREIMGDFLCPHVRLKLKEMRAFLEKLDIRTYKDMAKVRDPARRVRTELDDSFRNMYFGKDFDDAFDDLKKAVALSPTRYRAKDGVFKYKDHLMEFTPDWCFMKKFRVDIPWDVPYECSLIDVAIMLCTYRKVMKWHQKQRISDLGM